MRPFRITGASDEVGVFVTIGDKTIVFPDVTPDDLLDGARAYRQGAKIQNAFPSLNPDEREFLLTGITPTEWRELFP